MRPPRAFTEVSPGRYRESRGLYYDEFDVGDVIEHRPGRTVTDADNIWMSLLSLNAHPLHIDAAYAEQTEFGRPVVSSLVTLAIVGGMSTNGTSARAVANLGWEEIRLTTPVFVGDTLTAESEVVAKRLSRSRPGTGVVTFRTRGLKSDGTPVMTFTRSALIPCADGSGAA
ncbi:MULTISPECIES: MaoC family dehydratase [unclassified Micromonospora]|uniref:MaoC family dehydratase n=1 Tax=unclassified Micromonospora TaxID=2617518 RepID=UPI003247F9E9